MEHAISQDVGINCEVSQSCTKHRFFDATTRQVRAHWLTNLEEQLVVWPTQQPYLSREDQAQITWQSVVQQNEQVQLQVLHLVRLRVQKGKPSVFQ